jgi:hypothetical protein
MLRYAYGEDRGFDGKGLRGLLIADFYGLKDFADSSLSI